MPEFSADRAHRARRARKARRAGSGCWSCAASREASAQTGTLRSISRPISPAAISRSAVTPGLFLVSIFGRVALAQHARAVGRGEHELEAVRDLGEAVFDGDAGHGSFRCRGERFRAGSRAAKTAGWLRCWAAYFRRWEWTIAFRSKSAVSNNALIITKSKCRACATSSRGILPCAARSPRGRPRRGAAAAARSSSQLGGRMKISTALGNSCLICSAPCQSISSTTSCAAGDARPRSRRCEVP